MKKLLITILVLLFVCSAFAEGVIVIPKSVIIQMKNKGLLNGADTDFLSFDELSDLELTEIGYILITNLKKLTPEEFHQKLTSQEAYIAGQIYEKLGEDISFIYGIKKSIIEDFRRKMQYISNGSVEKLCTKKLKTSYTTPPIPPDDKKHFSRMIDIEESATLKKNKLEFRNNIALKQGKINDINAIARSYSQEFLYGLTRRIQVGWDKTRRWTEYSGNDITENLDTVTLKYRFFEAQNITYTAGYRYFRNNDIADQDENDYFISVGYPVSKLLDRRLTLNLVKVDHRTDDLDSLRMNLGFNYQISGISPVHLMLEALQNENKRFQYLNLGFRIIKDPATVDIFYKENLDSNISTIGSGLRFIF